MKQYKIVAKLPYSTDHEFHCVGIGSAVWLHEMIKNKSPRVVQTLELYEEEDGEWRLVPGYTVRYDRIAERLGEPLPYDRKPG